MDKIAKITDAGDISGKKVLLRADFNVPVKDGKILDTYRIDKTISTIDFLRQKKAKIIIISHIESEEKTLLPVWDYLKGFFNIKFVKDYFIKETDVLISEMKEGDVVLFENLRSHSGEKDNDLDFGKKLSVYGDLYVNDAFAVSHRKHCSVVLLPKLLPSFFGPLFVEEFENLSRAFNPKHPFLFILGGAKFSTKIPLVRKFLPIADSIYITGALANDIFKSKNLEVGKSLVGENTESVSLVLEEGKDRIKYPFDCLVLDKESKTNERSINDIENSDYVVDIGPRSLDELFELIKKSEFILWNGPTGNYEIGFDQNTQNLAKFLANSGKDVIVGGGDTVSAIKALNILDKFTFVSTAGGAMLDFLANESLPAIEILKS